MTDFTLGAITAVRTCLTAKWKMREICNGLPKFTRDELVEAIDACRRHQDDATALTWVNAVLWYQARGVSLINGSPAETVLGNWKRVIPAAYY